MALGQEAKGVAATAALGAGSAAGIVVLIPETRKAVVNKVKELKSNIEKK